jgi:chromosome segregation ATPase
VNLRDGDELIDGAVETRATISQDWSDLLDLLADAEEEALSARTSLIRAEATAVRSAARAEALDNEIAGMTESLVELDRKLDDALHQIKSAQTQLTQSEDRVAALNSELAAARHTEQELLDELQRIRNSRTWRAIRSLRRVIPVGSRPA